MKELWDITLGHRKTLDLRLFYFPLFIQLLQQSLVKKVESGTDVLNVYLEEVGIRK